MQLALPSNEDEVDDDVGHGHDHLCDRLRNYCNLSNYDQSDNDNEKMG